MADGNSITQTEFLAQLETHPWCYNHSDDNPACIQARKNNSRLHGITTQSTALKTMHERPIRQAISRVYVGGQHG